METEQSEPEQVTPDKNGKDGSNTPQGSTGRKNYTPKQREWMFAALCMARAQLKKTVMTDFIGEDVVEKACEILLKQQYFSKVQHKPCKSTLRNVWKTFWHPSKTVSNIGCDRGRPRREDSGDSNRVVSAIKGAQKAKTGKKTSKSLVNKISVAPPSTIRQMKELHMGFYRMYRPAKLTEPLIRSRQEFASELIIAVNPHLGKDAYGKWKLRNPRDNLHRLAKKSSFESILHIWIGINKNLGALGPYFLDDLIDPCDRRPEVVDGELEPDKRKKHTGLPRVMTETLFKELLENHVVKDLTRSVSFQMLRQEYWWHQDLCGPRVHQAPITFLRSIFGSKIMAPFNSDYKCPVRSPDLNPVEYEFMQRFVETIRDKRPCSVAQIKQAARGAMASLLPVVLSIIDDYPNQLKACNEYKGARFESWLRDYKQRVVASGTCAACCERVVRTLCDNCNRLMFACIEQDQQLERHHEARNPIYENDADDVIEPLPIN